MKRLLAIVVLLCALIQPAHAEHIKGGEMYYEYLGSSGGSSSYRITLKLYIDCKASSPGQLDTKIPITIFDRTNNNQYGQPLEAPMTNESFIQFDPASNPCIGNPPTDVCYRIRWFSTTVSLPINTAGYLISYQRCCRIFAIVNLTSPSNSVGATYMCEIPGTGIQPDGYANNSPQFTTNDATAICRGSIFTLDFSANQSDLSDSVSYSFCSGMSGASQGNPNPTSSAQPPYSDLKYQFPYGGSAPLGSNVSINPRTGLITGVAPTSLGQYVITVCCYEYRRGTLINIHRKDVHVAVSDCVPLKALLKPNYDYCDDFLVTFRNEQINPAGSIYIWSYGDNTNADTTTDIEGRIQHQYADTGTYKVKLKVILAGQCIDSTTTLAKVYPGFYPGFVWAGSCLFTPIQFTDTTKTKYGTVSAWRWNFGDLTTSADTALLKTPTWKYADTGMKRVQLIVQSDKGCIDTVYHDVPIKSKPTITLAFKDTLICSNPTTQDSLQLHAGGLGIFSWSPLTRIFNENTPDPTVYPTVTTNYVVQLNENGCISTDTVRVRVVPFVTLNAGPDSTICLTDTTQLKPLGDGLKFQWTANPASYISNPNTRNPFVTPVTTTTYHVIAHIGKCNTADDIRLTTVPYPGARVSGDTAICYQDTATISGSMIGIRFNWAPTRSLTNPTSLTTEAFPLVTTRYVLSVYDTLGCPKPGRDTVVVTVRDEIFANAGNDTSVVVDQPLQMHGTGAELIEWQPNLYLNHNDIYNPVAVLEDNMRYIMRAYTLEGCYDLDTLNIKVFKTNPDIFVPNAFRPDGVNNRVLRPIPAGISNLEYFRIYNRWGQMMFQTTEIGKGWDGNFGGKAQPAATYVWMVKGKDYTGKEVFRKGVAVLVR
jgi:gliding motility-associated-like protein